jgi:L-ascorbate metabolism protein UlaG (beta-lactamase superfamily)
MNVFSLVVGMSLLPAAASPDAEAKFEVDTIKTAQGDLKITCIAHGTLMFQFGELVIHVDPVGSYADYSKMPKADIILVTHEHGDHLDADAIAKLSKPETELVTTATCAEKLGKGTVMKNGETKKLKDLQVQAVPAYNIVHMRGASQPYHPKGVGNGYVITFGDKRVYVAGDTENIPEMADLAGVDIAFLPMNVPYTMTPQMVAEAVKVLKPKILYPYHFGNTDTSQLVKLLEDNKDVEVRIRKMQ